MGDKEQPNGSFRCHPKCLERSYMRQVLREIKEEISGLQPGQFVELVLAVDEAESTTWWADRPVTRIGRRAAVELVLRGWGETEVDTAFGFLHGATTRVMSTARIHAKARDIVAAHLEGESPSQIGRGLGVGIPTVTEILKGIGEEPHRIHDRAKGADLNRSIQKLYEEGRSYREIAERLGITESNVRQRLQYLRRKGRLGTPRRGFGGRAAD